MFPHQEPCVRGPPSKDLYQMLRGGSSYTRLLMREHSKYKNPPRGGVSFDQLFLMGTVALYSVTEYTQYSDCFNLMCTLTFVYEITRHTHMCV